jgi:hypothetical protein
MPNKDDSNGPADAETPESVAHYIAALTGELAKIARRNGLDTLSEILEMARLEARPVGQAIKRAHAAQKFAGGPEPSFCAQQFRAPSQDHACHASYGGERD